MKAFAAIAIVLSVFFIIPHSVRAQIWTQTHAPAHNWEGVACSADGSKLAVVGMSVNAIGTSPDAGNTWASNTVPAYEWWNVASSADGTKLIAVAAYNGNVIYTSTDSGATWTSNNVSPYAW